MQTSIRTVSAPTQIRKSIFKVKTKILTTWVARIIKGGPVVVVTPYHISRFYRQWFKKLGGNSHGRNAVCVKAWQKLSVTCYTCYCCISSDPLRAVVVRSPYTFLYQNFSSYQMCKIRNYGVTDDFQWWKYDAEFCENRKIVLKFGRNSHRHQGSSYVYCPSLKMKGRHKTHVGFLQSSTVRKTLRNWDPREKSVLLVDKLKHSISDSKRGLVRLMENNKLVSFQ